MSGFSRGEFHAREPFPHWVCDGLLTDECWSELAETFPAEERFERHDGIARVHGQRPHNRHYLAYETSLYNNQGGDTRGVITHSDLSPAWQRFLDALSSRDYRSFLAEALGTKDYVLRFAWHRSTRGDEVSPHVDADEKLGTQLFYFNRSTDWLPEYGGATLLLADRKTESLAPDVSDFSEVTTVAPGPNRSLLMRNSPDAWHGVEPLQCPPTTRRLLFNVIAERPDARSNRGGEKAGSTKRWRRFVRPQQ